MEVDPPTTSASSNGNSNLKRSNSAPMINVLAATHVEPSSSLFRSSESSRLRRFSSSSASLNLQASTPVKIPDRVNQIKHEESHITHRETAHEREIQSTMQMSNSWESFSLEPMVTDQRRPRSFSESLHIFTSPSLSCSSPSPTRLVKQCFSPAMQMPVKNNTFTPSPSPSPTRTTFRRCLSPIATRPASHLGKRKFEGDSAESYLSPPKRFNSGPNTPDKTGVLAQPLAHSVSLSSVESGSPDQTVPHGSSMAVDTVHIVRKSHCFGFTPVREPSTEMQTTDSETSDIIEMSDGHEVTSSSTLVSASGDQTSSSFPHIKQTQV
ncbi:P2R1A-PPP2R2A-interacting phosphatase regulator 1-like [Liolophura sinensis]|uniref:P2R1A-PPP2R2A-interacting phosphatase regulator 1-like n=1 Tax=Liolophura sinensis TaxID=3198878 RepID=UPI00315885B1